MEMQVCDVVRRVAVSGLGHGPLVDAENVGEGALEDVVVADGEAAERVGECGLLSLVELSNRENMSVVREHCQRMRERQRWAERRTEDFKRPGGPPWNDGNPVLVEEDDAGLFAELEGGVFAEQACAIVLRCVLLERLQLCRGLCRYARG